MPRNPYADLAIPEVIEMLRNKQRIRRFCIVSQSRCDRSIEQLLVQLLGGAGGDEAMRKQMFKRVTEFRRKVEKGGGGHGTDAREGQTEVAPSASLLAGNTDLAEHAHLVVASAEARATWDKKRDEAESAMRALTKCLSPPVIEFVKSVRGFGIDSLAVIIAETGDLSNYPARETVWKRLGLAVIDGERQRRVPGAEAALEHAYDPERRAEVWSRMDPLFRAQWAGARDEDGVLVSKSGKPVAVPAHPLGPYGEVYARRRAATAGREGWTPMHCKNDAVRVMSKAVLEDLWRVWIGKSPRRRGQADIAPDASGDEEMPLAA